MTADAPKDLHEAYNIGYDDATGPMRIGSSWPSEDQMAYPDALVRAFMRGHSDGEKAKNLNNYSGCHS